MKINGLGLVFAAVAGLCVAFPVAGAAAAETAQGPHSEAEAIQGVLRDYRTAVSTGDEALFLTTLLDNQIPFFAVDAAADRVADPVFTDLQGVADFRLRVFHSGILYRQTFDQIKIDQHGALAQVTLHFVTRVRDSQEGGQGWKTLTLLKAGLRWKIVSEFYTVGNLVT